MVNSHAKSTKPSEARLPVVVRELSSANENDEGVGHLQWPTITPSSGTLTAAPLVAITCTTSGATIRYTLEGSHPTERSPRFVYPILVTLSGTVKARAFKAR